MHSFATLEVSPVAYDEVARKLRAAGYHDAFCDTGLGKVIDMHGVGLVRGAGPAVDLERVRRLRERSDQQLADLHRIYADDRLDVDTPLRP
jgi:hypothetical protein